MSEPVPPPIAPAEPEPLPYRGQTAEVPAEWTNVTAHGIRPEMAFLEWRRALAILLSLWVPMVLGYVAFSTWLVIHRQQFLAVTMLGVLVALLASMSVRLFRTRRKFNRQWPTFRIFIADQGFLRTRMDLPDLVVPWEKVRKVKEIRSGLIVYGPANVIQVMIPKSLEGYAEVRERVAGHHVIATGSRAFFALRLIPTFALLGCFFVGSMTASSELRWVMFGVTLAIAIWNMIIVLPSPNVSVRQKVFSPVVFLIPLMLVMRDVLPVIVRRLLP